MRTPTQLDVRGAEPRRDAVLLREEDALDGVEGRGSGVEGGDRVRTRRGEGEMRGSGEKQDEVEDRVVLRARRAVRRETSSVSGTITFTQEKAWHTYPW